MDCELQILDWTRAKPLAEIVRRRVFIEEQNVPESMEWDKWDAFGVHIVAIFKGAPIGTVRLGSNGKIGRLAVLPAHRHQALGSRLLLAIVQIAQERGILKPHLHAQVHALDFYRRHGFVECGEIFTEAGIEHQLMHYQKA